jgi:uncharacterized ubiquitin-like protein YukD
VEQPQNAQTVMVRVQVIDMKSQTLDLTLPNYLPAKDLTQRVARDAGLQAYWPGGERRLYWLRARGRLMQDDERLMDLGVVPGELIHLLPEPPRGSGVEEQIPDYPETRGYAARGTLALVGSMAATMTWALAWGIALTVDRSLPVVLLPGLGLGLLCCSMARHLFGGEGYRARVAGVGLLFAIALVTLAFAGPIAFGEAPGQIFGESVPGFVMAMFGVLFAWLAWWGAVEPLPPARKRAEVVEEVAVAVNCDICGLPVDDPVRLDCPYRCGKVFHSGCHAARSSVYRGEPNNCAVCGVQVRATS